MKKLLAMLLALAMLFSLAACSNTQDDPGKTDPGTTNTDTPNNTDPGTEYTGWTAGQAGHYTYTYWGSTPSTWSPTDWEQSGESNLLGRISTPLYSFRLNADKTDYVRIPDAAAELPIDVTAQYAGNEKYGVPENATSGRVYEVKLNEKLCWEDGTPVTADDYIYTISQFLNPEMLNFRASLFYEGNTALANARLYYNSLKTGMDYHSINDEWNAPELQWDALVKGDDGCYYTADGRPVYVDWNIPTEYFYEESVRDWVGEGDGWITTDAYALDAYVNDDGYVPLTDEAYNYIQPLFDSWGDGYTMVWVCSYGTPVEPNGYTMDDVGVIKNDDYSLTFFLTKHVDADVFADTLSGNLYCVKKDIYEANKKEVGGLIKSSYGTSIDTCMSYGPYKMESFQPDKQTVLVKNENWYGYEAGSIWDGYYQTTDIVIQYLENDATARMLFLQGALSSYTVGADDMVTYAGSDYIKYSLSDYTWMFDLNSDVDSLKQRDGNGINHSILSVLEFRKAFSLCIDRTEFATTTAGYTPTYTLLNSYYTYNDIVYRNTEAGESVLKRLYNVDDVSKVTGQNIEEARTLFQQAYDTAVAEGLMSATDKVQIDYWDTADDSTTQNRINYLNSYLAEATKGTDLEGKVSVVLKIGQDLYSNMSNGLCDMIGNSWGGAYQNPYWMMLCYCDESYNVAYGFDVYNTKWTFNVNGEDVTYSANDWYIELFEGEYSGADKDTRDAILADMEYELLSYYGNIPMLSQGSATLYQMRLKHGSDTWVNNVISYGGFSEYTYTMDDAQWEAYCASNNYQLQY